MLIEFGICDVCACCDVCGHEDLGLAHFSCGHNICPECKLKAEQLETPCLACWSKRYAPRQLARAIIEAFAPLHAEISRAQRGLLRFNTGLWKAVKHSYGVHTPFKPLLP